MMHALQEQKMKEKEMKPNTTVAEYTLCATTDSCSAFSMVVKFDVKNLHEVLDDSM
jgi:hypothetical protein